MSSGFYAIRDVVRLTTLSDTTIWRFVKAGQFPKPVKISERRSVWPAEDVDRWMAARAPNAAGEQIVNEGRAA